MCVRVCVCGVGGGGWCVSLCVCGLGCTIQNRITHRNTFLVPCVSEICDSIS